MARPKKESEDVPEFVVAPAEEVATPEVSEVPDFVSPKVFDAFAVNEFGGSFYVYSKDGRRISGPMDEERANDLRKRFQGR